MANINQEKENNNMTAITKTKAGAAAKVIQSSRMTLKERIADYKKTYGPQVVAAFLAMSGDVNAYRFYVEMTGSRA